MAENSFTEPGFWEHFVSFPRKNSKTQSSLNFLQSGPRKFSKSDFSGLAPIQRVLNGHGPLNICFWKGKDDDHDQDFLKKDLLYIWSWSSDKFSSKSLLKCGGGEPSPFGWLGSQRKFFSSYWVHGPWLPLSEVHSLHPATKAIYAGHFS